MKGKLSSLLAIGILLTTLIIVTIKYYQLRSSEKELQSLLVKSRFAIERDNENIHDNLWHILNDSYLAKNRPYLPEKKRIFDSLIKSLKIIDSAKFSRDLKENIRNQLALNDSLIDFYYSWTHHGILNQEYSILPVFKHKPVYTIGDTLEYTLYSINQLGFKDITYEIIDFNPRKFGKSTQTTLTYSIPISQLVKTNVKPFDYEFNFNYVLKNNYTQKLDTSYWTENFMIIP